MLGIFKKHSYQGTYTGDVRNDMAHGFGKLEFKDGSNYEGGFLFDEFHGGGKFTFSDDGFIEGKWTKLCDNDGWINERSPHKKDLMALLISLIIILRDS